jgi:hypothetical protein
VLHKAHSLVQNKLRQQGCNVSLRTCFYPLPVCLQAVQLLPEHQVWPGQHLHMTASHDTYAISFAIAAAPPATPQQRTLSTRPASCTTNSSSTHQTAPSCASAGADSGEDTMASAVCAPAMPAAPQPTGVAFVDPLWKAAYDAVSALQASLAKAATQDPLEYRRLVSAALLLAMRPWGTQTAAAATTGSAAAACSKAAAGSGEAQKSAAAVLGNGGQPDTAREVLCGSKTGVSRHLIADPHHAAALLVRLMS